ncbi:uncharacterized protein LOC135847551 [Planococcus citri]|uniref:uncharacterized protein LOC135847551 n=1 Tax=Planococcus citri TaxID=170843 RepID=UPI0031F7D793
MAESTHLACDKCGLVITSHGKQYGGDKKVPESIYITKCQHLYHKSCIMKAIKDSELRDPAGVQLTRCTHIGCERDVKENICYKVEVTRIQISTPEPTGAATGELQALRREIAQLHTDKELQQDLSEDMYKKMSDFEVQLTDANNMIASLKAQLETTTAKYEALRKAKMSSLFPSSTAIASHLNQQSATSSNATTPASLPAVTATLPTNTTPISTNTASTTATNEPCQGFVPSPFPPPPPVNNGSPEVTPKIPKPSKNAERGIPAPTPVDAGIPQTNAATASNLTQGLHRPPPGFPTITGAAANAATNATTNAAMTATTNATTTGTTMNTSTITTNAATTTATRTLAHVEDAADGALISFKIPFVQPGTAPTVPDASFHSPISSYWDFPQKKETDYWGRPLAQSGEQSNSSAPDTANTQNSVDPNANLNVPNQAERAQPTANQSPAVVPKKKKRAKPGKQSNTKANRDTFDSRYPEVTHEVLAPFYPTNAYPQHFSVCGLKIGEAKPVMALFAYKYWIVGDIHAHGIMHAITEGKPYHDNIDKRMYKRDMKISELIELIVELKQIPKNLMISIGTFDIFSFTPPNTFDLNFRKLIEVLGDKKVEQVIMLPPNASGRLHNNTFRQITQTFSYNWGTGKFQYMVASHLLNDLNLELASVDELGPKYTKATYQKVANCIAAVFIPEPIIEKSDSTVELNNANSAASSPATPPTSKAKLDTNVDSQQTSAPVMPQFNLPKSSFQQSPNDIVTDTLSPSYVNPQLQQATANYLGNKAVGTPPYPKVSTATPGCHPLDPRNQKAKSTTSTKVEISPYSGLHLTNVGFSDDEQKPLTDKEVIERAKVLTKIQADVKASKAKEQERLAADAKSRESLKEKMEWKKEADNAQAGISSSKEKPARNVSEQSGNSSEDSRNKSKQSSSKTPSRATSKARERSRSEHRSSNKSKDRKVKSGDESSVLNTGLKPNPTIDNDKYIGFMVKTPPSGKPPTETERRMYEIFGNTEGVPEPTDSTTSASASESDTTKVVKSKPRKSRSSIKTKLSPPQTLLTYIPRQQRAKQLRVNAALKRDLVLKKVFGKQSQPKVQTEAEHPATEGTVGTQPKVLVPKLDLTESTPHEKPVKTVDLTESAELDKPLKTIDLTKTVDPSAEEELPRGAQSIEQRTLTKVDTAVQDTTLTLHSVENDEFTTIRQVVTTVVTTEAIETTEPAHLVGTYDLTNESPRNDEESQQPVSPRTEAALLDEGVQQTGVPAIEPSNDDEGEDDEEDEDDEDL